MYIEDENFNKTVYSLRTALSDIYVMAEKMYESDNDAYRKVLLEEIRECVTGFPQISHNESGDSKSEDISGLKLKDAKALVIEDNDINNYLIVSILEHFGVEADVATSGSKAVEMYQKNQYDIVFIDNSMPDMDGTEAARRIRALECGRGQLIIGLSATTMPEFKEGLNALGIELILSKPVKQEQIGFILLKELPDKAVIDFTS